MTTNRFAQAGAVFFALWGVVHVLGAGLQLLTLRSQGPLALAAMVGSAMPGPVQGEIPAAAAAFMGMGAFNLLWIGMLVTVIAVTLNWRNDRLGFWLNAGIVASTDLALVLFLLLSGVMSWSNGGVGVSLFALALLFASVGRARAKTA